MNRLLRLQNDPLRVRRGPALIWLLALLLVAMGCSISMLFWQLSHPAQAARFLGVGLLSRRVADYGVDPRSLNFPVVDASILGDILRDKDPHAADLPVRMATLGAVLDAPIPTATRSAQGLPFEQATSAPPPSPNATFTLEPMQTSSPFPAAGTVATETVRPTQRPVFTLTPLVGARTATQTLAPANPPTSRATPTRRPRGVGRPRAASGLVWGFGCQEA